MPIFYPSLVCSLTLRFDEALLRGETPTPRSAEDLAELAGGPNGPAAEKARMLAASATPLSRRLAIMPRQASLELPGYRQAGKFSLNFAFKDFPMDPRAFRAVGVEIFVGVVSSSDFARGMRGEVDRGRLASVIAADPKNMMLAGTVDNFSYSHTEKGSEVTLDGRGLQGIFLDAKLDPASLKGLDLSKDIKEVVKQILAKAPAGARLQVHVTPEEWPGGKLPSPAAQEVVNRINSGADGKKPGRPVKGDANTMSFWDAITQFCFLVGAVPYFEGHDLRIRPAHSLYDQRVAGTPGNPTPFAGGSPRTILTANGPLERRVRLMVYGRNLKSFKLERKLGGTKVPSVKCVSTDDTKKGKDRLIEVTWPDDAPPSAKIAKAKVTRVDANGETAQTDVLRVPVPGIKDKVRLLAVARNIYEEIGRGEMGGSASTKDLASIGGDNEDADILRLRPGDAVEFVTEASGAQGVPPTVSDLNTAAGEGPDDALRRVASLLGDEVLAQQLIDATNGKFEGLQSTFRTANVKYSWDAQSGIGVDFDFQNYVEARSDVTKPEEEAPKSRPKVIRSTTFDVVEEVSKRPGFGGFSPLSGGTSG